MLNEVQEERLIELAKEAVGAMKQIGIALCLIAGTLMGICATLIINLKP